jgi:hypothetical protein
MEKKNPIRYRLPFIRAKVNSNKGISDSLKQTQFANQLCIHENVLLFCFFVI